MKKRVSGRRRTRGGAPITDPGQIVADRKYKVSDSRTGYNLWEFRVKPDQIRQFKDTIVDPIIYSWLQSFEMLNNNHSFDLAYAMTDEYDATIKPMVLTKAQENQKTQKKFGYKTPKDSKYDDLVKKYDALFEKNASSIRPPRVGENKLLIESYVDTETSDPVVKETSDPVVKKTYERSIDRWLNQGDHSVVESPPLDKSYIDTETSDPVVKETYDKRKIIVCTLKGKNEVEFLNINDETDFNKIKNEGRSILIFQDSLFSVYNITPRPNQNDVDVEVEHTYVSINLSVLSQITNALKGTPKQPLSTTEVPAAVSTAVPAGGKSRRKKRVNRKKHTKKIRQ